MVMPSYGRTVAQQACVRRARWIIVGVVCEIPSFSRWRSAAAMPLTCAAPSPSTAPSTTKAVFADVDGMVHPVTAEIVSSAIDMAKRDSGFRDRAASQYAWRIDGCHARYHPTDPGLTDSGGHLRRAQRGAFGIGGLLYSGGWRHRGHGARHEHRGARIRWPMGGEMDAVMKEKVENDAAAYMRSICDQTRAQRRAGRNGGAAKQVVHRSRSPQPASDRSDRA